MNVPSVGPLVRFWWWARRTVKRLLCRFMCLYEFCDTCGRHVEQVWTAEDDLWRFLVGGDGAGVRCIRCFDRLAERRRIFIRWSPVVEHHPVEVLQMQRPSEAELEVLANLESLQDEMMRSVLIPTGLLETQKVDVVGSVKRAMERDVSIDLTPKLPTVSDSQGAQ